MFILYKIILSFQYEDIFDRNTIESTYNEVLTKHHNKPYIYSIER